MLERKVGMRNRVSYLDCGNNEKPNICESFELFVEIERDKCNRAIFCS